MKIYRGIILGMCFLSGVVYANDYFDPTPQGGSSPQATQHYHQSASQFNDQGDDQSSGSNSGQKADFLKRYEVISAS